MTTTRQSVLCYTTTISVEKTVAEISALLAVAKTTAILSEFTGGICTAISFRINTEFGLLTFRLPANIDAVYVILQRSRLIPPRLRTKEQAARVAWRIILHWLDAQLAMIQSGLVLTEQVFLPYCQDSTGTTLFERFRRSRYSTCLLERNPASGEAAS
ncbi:MAG: hypothetical protein JO170_25025 [Verrucomicrobia bacterium]|nr:hypothetical protein [Verrucomicrobiota bacterium]